MELKGSETFLKLDFLGSQDFYVQNLNQDQLNKRHEFLHERVKSKSLLRSYFNQKEEYGQRPI